MNVSKDLLKYFNYNERDIFSNIEEIFFNYLIILKEKDVKLFKKYINTFTINNELLFAFKLILTFNLYDVFKKENLLFESEQELFSDFFNEKGNLFIDFLNHVTYDKDSLELKVISILNKSKDIRVLNVMDEYLESQNKEDYFDKLLLS